MNQLEKSMEFNEEEVDEAEQQQQLYAQTIRASSAEPSRQIKRSSSLTSQTRRLANSENFHKRTTNTTSSNNFNFALHSTNDFKYIGEQFKVGKINPCLQSTSEKLFQKMYKDKLSKLYDSSKNLNSPVSPRTTNDDKWRGMQLRMGTFQSPNVSEPGMPFEQKFQTLFRHKLDLLKPKNIKSFPSYMELKQTHEYLLPVRKWTNHVFACDNNRYMYMLILD